MQNNLSNSSGPWWKFGHMWLVVGGPLVVVAASFITLYLAITRPDPVVSEDYYQQGIHINEKQVEQSAASLAPAMQGRNHAATGVAPPAPSVKP
jgi:uncharacterized protein